MSDRELPILPHLQEIRNLLSEFAGGRDVDPEALVRAFDGFEAACEERGLFPSRPDTIVGSLARQLRNEVLSVADYLQSK